MCIPPELEERVGKAWFESVPEQFRLGQKDKGLISDRFLSAAIIAPPAPPSVCERFLRSIFGEQHLTEKQIAAKIARQNIGRPGRKKAQTISDGRPSRAKGPYEPGGMSFSEFADETKPFQDLDLLRR